MAKASGKGSSGRGSRGNFGPGYRSSYAPGYNAGKGTSYAPSYARGCGDAASNYGSVLKSIANSYAKSMARSADANPGYGKDSLGLGDNAVYIMDGKALIAFYNAMTAATGEKGNNPVVNYGALENAVAGYAGLPSNALNGSKYAGEFQNGAYLVSFGKSGLKINALGMPVANAYLADGLENAVQSPIGVYDGNQLVITGKNTMTIDGALDGILDQYFNPSADGKQDFGDSGIILGQRYKEKSEKELQEELSRCPVCGEDERICRHY